MPSSTLKGIEQKLQSLRKGTIARLAENIEDSEDIAGLLGELQDALDDYKVCSYHQASTIYS